MLACPKNYDEFFAAADKGQEGGLHCRAHGGQNWQDFTTFESVALGVGGVSSTDALVSLDPKTIGSDTMGKVLEVFRKIKGSYTDPGRTGRDWNLATAMVMKGDAAFQFMGDWAKGEFMAAGKVPGKDFMCRSARHGQRFHIQRGLVCHVQAEVGRRPEGQADLAAAIMGPEFQEVFNLNKGSVPVRLANRQV